MITNFFNRGKTTALLAIAALLVPVGQSFGQQNALVFPWHAQGGQVTPYTYQPAPTVPSVENSRAFYPGTADPDKVWVDVTIPADARITFEGGKTTQTGAVRHFVSPSITPGYTYAYTVEATWMENGQQVNQARTFNVRAGDVLHLTFSRDRVDVRRED